MRRFSKDLRHKIRLAALRWFYHETGEPDLQDESFQLRATIGQCTRRRTCSPADVLWSQIVCHMPELSEDEQDTLLFASQRDAESLLAIVALAIADACCFHAQQHLAGTTE